MNTEHTNQPKQAAEAAFEQWWQRHGLTDPMDDEDRQYATASSWARRGYLAAMQAQQAEPVAWHTNDPCVSGEHIEAIAKVCKIIPSYTTAEYVARIVGFGHVLLADKSVQEAFVRANSHLLRTDTARPPAVADTGRHTPPFGNCKFQLCDLPGQCRSEGKCHHPTAASAVAVPDDWRDAMERAAEDLEDNNCLESAHQLRAMLAAAQKNPRQTFAEYQLGKPFSIPAEAKLRDIAVNSRHGLSVMFCDGDFQVSCTANVWLGDRPVSGWFKELPDAINSLWADMEKARQEAAAQKGGAA